MAREDGRDAGLSRRSVLRRGALGGSLSIVGLSAIAGTAEGTDGQVLTECTTIDESGHYTLGNDLSADGTCLVVEGSVDVTLDGDGYALRGNGTGVGIDVSDSTLDVRDLQVRGFETGIRQNLAETRLEEVLVEANTGDGIQVWQYRNLRAKDCTIRQNGAAGIAPGDRTGVNLTDCEIRANGGDAVDAATSNGVVLRRCLVADNGGPVYISPVVGGKDVAIFDSVIRTSAGAGLRTRISDTPSHIGSSVPVRNCEIRDNDGPGIYHNHGFLDVRNCTLARNQDGYRVDDPILRYEATLRHNNIVENEAYGAFVEPDYADTPVDARCNYWGHPTGPAHEDNPRRRPKGQPVSDLVEFIPWSVREIVDGEGVCVGGRGGGNRDGGKRGGG